MLNKWRWVNYTDEGCDLYECLSCYNRWDARTSPREFRGEGGKIIAGWIFCPYCGIKWAGEIKWEVDERRDYGSRSVGWRIESRNIWKNSKEWSNWQAEHCYASVDTHPDYYQWPREKRLRWYIVKELKAIKRERLQEENDGYGLPITYEYRIVRDR